VVVNYGGFGALSSLARAVKVYGRLLIAYNRARQKTFPIGTDMDAIDNAADDAEKSLKKLAADINTLANQLPSGSAFKIVLPESPYVAMSAPILSKLPEADWIRAYHATPDAMTIPVGADALKTDLYTINATAFNANVYASSFFSQMLNAERVTALLEAAIPGVSQMGIMVPAPPADDGGGPVLVISKKRNPIWIVLAAAAAIAAIAAA
jgi:hypothetical protein